MSRLTVTLILALCLTVYSGIAFAQEGETAAEMPEGTGTLARDSCGYKCPGKRCRRC